jgi:hypothetical protein
MPFSRENQLLLAPVAAALALKIENLRLRDVRVPLSRRPAPPGV